jgi:hypothetical protein
MLREMPQDVGLRVLSALAPAMAAWYAILAIWVAERASRVGVSICGTCGCVVVAGSRWVARAEREKRERGNKMVGGTRDATTYGLALLAAGCHRRYPHLPALHANTPMQSLDGVWLAGRRHAGLLSLNSFRLGAHLGPRSASVLPPPPPLRWLSLSIPPRPDPWSAALVEGQAPDGRGTGITLMGRR